jgi:twinkle protein
VDYDAATVKQGLTDRVEDFCRWLLPSGKNIRGEWKVGSIDGEEGRSMGVPLSGPHLGIYKDFATDEGGSLIDLYMAVNDEKSFGKAVDDLGREFLQLPPDEKAIRGRHEPAGNATRVVPADECGIPIRPDSGVARWLSEERGLDLDLCSKYGVRQNERGDTALLAHSDGDAVVLVKHWKAGTKDVFTNKNPKHVLFGKQVADPEICRGELIITEGQWDAISWGMLGRCAVSIPSGVLNEQWIEHDWEWLRQFHTIYLSFDMDEEGQKARISACKRIGANKCKLIDLPLKDANDMVIAGRGNELEECFHKAYTRDPDELVMATEFRSDVHKITKCNPDKWGMPFPLNIPLRFRKHETTVWTGYTGHGKSSLVEDVCCRLAKEGLMSCLASLETRPDMTLAAMVKKWSGDGDIGHQDYFDEAYDALANNVLIYDYEEKCPPSALLDRFEYAHRRWGVANFVLDNVMMLKIDRQDNQMQSEAANDFKEFVKKYPVHLHIVAHPRKPPPGGASDSPSVHEVRGASEWCDMAFNVVSVWRNTKKESDLCALEQEGTEMAYQQAMELRMESPDGKVVVGKQRTTGKLPSVRFWFDEGSRRFVSAYGEQPEPYWKPEGS